MGSFLSSLSSTPLPPDNFNLMEMEPLSRSSEPTRSQFDSDLNQHSGRRYPLNPNGHFTTNLLTGFRHRLRINADKQISVQTFQDWSLEPLLTSTADDGPECKAGERTSGGCQSGDEEGIDQPINFKLDKLTAFNVNNRDHTIEKLRNELKELNGQLRNARKEIKILKERLLKAGN